MAWTCCCGLVLFLGAKGARAQIVHNQTTHTQTMGTITGVVTSVSGAPIAESTLTLPNLGRRTQTDKQGAFRFDGVPAGTHVLLADSQAGRAVVTLTVGGGQTVETRIELDRSSHFEELVVTGSADARSPLELASATTVLSGDALRQRLQSSLGETLEQEAGVSSTFFGPGASRPVIRGQSGDRVMVLEGGIGGGDVSAVSQDHAVSADPALSEQIEVLRGPATLLYGSSAIGGAVNIVDERIPTYRAIEAISGTVDLRASSVANERSAVVALNGGSPGRDDRWAWHLDGLQRRSDDYDIPGVAALDTDDLDEPDHAGEEHGDEEAIVGIVPNTDIEAESVRAGLSYFFGDAGFVGVSVSGLDTLYGIPGGGHGHEEEPEEGTAGEEEEEETVRIDLRQRRVDLRAERRTPFGPFSGFKVRAATTDYEHAELEGGAVGTRFFNDYGEARFELVQRRREGWSGSSGLQLSERELEAIGEEAFLPPTETARRALFTFQELERGALRWQFGARLESQEITPRSEDFAPRTDDGISASAGLVWELSEGWSLATALARSVKLPAPEELFSDGAHIATQTFEIGDPNLGTESSLGVDLSLRKTEGRLTGELTLFRNDFDDFIYPAFTGDTEDGLPVVLYTQRDAEFLGAELTARLELYSSERHDLHLRLSGDTVQAELAANGPLPRIPAARLGAGLHFHSGPIDATLEVRRVFEQNDVAVNETPTDGYTFLNASFGYRFTFGAQLLDLLVRGRNLTDQEARSHTSFLKSVAPLPGRDLGVSLRLWF